MPHTSLAKEDYVTFRDNDRSGPVHMLNLIRLREKANIRIALRYMGEATVVSPLLARLSPLELLG